MPISEGLAIIIGSVISALIGVAGSYGLTAINEEQQKALIRKAEENKATYSDVLKLVDEITRKAAALSQGAKNRLYNDINNIFNRPGISSGLVETVTGRIRQNLANVTQKVEQLVTEANALQASADNHVSAFSTYSAQERANAKNSDGTWNLDSAAGRSGAEAERLANEANAKYTEAKNLGEKYV